MPWPVRALIKMVYSARIGRCQISRQPLHVEIGPPAGRPSASGVVPLASRKLEIYFFRKNCSAASCRRSGPCPRCH